MTKSPEIRPNILTPQPLQEKEAEKVKQQTLQKNISQADQARLAQQAGFHRTAKKLAKSFDVGDSSRSPIPLPEDDVDGDNWAAERLDTAQRNLGLAGTQFEEFSKSEAVEELDMAGVVTAGSFLPTEQGVENLKKLSVREGRAEPLPLDEVTTSVERLFAIKFDEEVSVGHKILATGLVVAGELGSVDVDKGRINEHKLASGIKKVTERGNQSVGEAQRMSKGIDRELNVQRTFVFKR